MQEFLFVVVDIETGEFSIHGPMRDDTGWTDRVFSAQRRGRRVRCYTVRDTDQGEARRAAEQELGLRFIQEVSLL